MAQRSAAVPENVAGEIFVDDSCIDCDTCRQIAPGTFADAGGHSYVHRQPADGDERRAAQRAALCCPTNSIGAGPGMAEAVGDFPLAVADGVFSCGFTAESSFGASSWLIVREGGNWLIDSPRWVPALAAAIERLGGIARIFLTHRDDVADAARYAERFGAERIIHRADRASAPGAEIVIDGIEPRAFADDLVVIPVPGHTAGSCVLLHRERFLFSGDHLWWDRERGRLDASRTHCWHSWSEQGESMARLAGRRFEWVLPGHGDRVQLPAERMRSELAALVDRMRGSGPGPVPAA